MFKKLFSRVSIVQSATAEFKKIYITSKNEMGYLVSIQCQINVFKNLIFSFFKF